MYKSLLKPLLCSILLVLLSFQSWAQTDIASMPFNYQALYRNSSGKAASNTTMSKIRVRYYTDPSGTAIYTEDFSNITTDAYGLFSLKLGTGTPLVSGQSFANNINWATSQIYIKITVDNKDLTSDPVAFNAVPYAKAAQKVVWTDYAVFEEMQNGGTNAPQITSSGWLTRGLNTDVTKTGSKFISLNSNNQVVLAPGKYYVSGWCEAYETGRLACMFYNSTDGTVEIRGSSAYMHGGSDNGGNTRFEGFVTVTGTTKKYELQMYSEQKTSSSFTVYQGVATDAPLKSGSSSKSPEVFSHVFIQKID